MQAVGERIIVFGDSTTHTGPDAGPEIQDIVAGSAAVATSPGAVLAERLLEQGAAAVRTNSRVGRSAVNFFGRENVQALYASDQAFAPTKVVVVLGTNDIGMGIDQTRQALEQIRVIYEGLGAEVWAFGPYAYTGPASLLNDQAGPYVEMFQDVFGKRFIDARPLTVSTDRAGDGVHFGFQSARMTGDQMALALLETRGPMSWWMTGLLVGAGVVAGLAIWRGIKRHRGQALLGNVSADDGLDDEDPAVQKFRKHQRFNTLVQDEDPNAIDVAEDYALEQDIKLSRDLATKEGRYKQTGGFTLSTDIEKPTRVQYSLEPGMSEHTWHNAIEVVWQGERVTFSRALWERRAARGEDPIPPGSWQDQNRSKAKIDELRNKTYITERYDGSPDYAAKSAAADAWAVTKALRRLDPEASIDEVRTTVVKALDQDNSEPSELYGVDRIPGGRAAGRSPSSFNRKQLKAGAEHEMEHTDDPEIAREIAMDHLAEDPAYYKKLATIDGVDVLSGLGSGGKIIGQTQSGKPIYQSYTQQLEHGGSVRAWTAQDHHDAADAHRAATPEGDDDEEREVRARAHIKSAERHEAAAQQIYEAVDRLRPPTAPKAPLTFARAPSKPRKPRKKRMSKAERDAADDARNSETSEYVKRTFGRKA